jgi:hypothetical protein
MCFSGVAILHPSSILIAVLTVVVAIQFFAMPGLAGLALVLLAFARGSVAAWWRMLRRTRWLLLSVWLIVAYEIPGEALFGLDWLPTHEGAAEATLQAARLMLMLGCLAWLLGRLGRTGLMSALLGLLKPFAARLPAVERLVVRLALVMENLERDLPRNGWREMLSVRQPDPADAAVMQVALPLWRASDFLLCAGVLGAAMVAAWLG